MFPTLIEELGFLPDRYLPIGQERNPISVLSTASVVKNGRIVLEGNSREFLEQEMIRKAYLLGL
ncbi:MAG: hypothetical protein JXL84_12060 [Deltaproteobacteria bacterium]|nr:hypothetical protein [Deltaproteobacteria bacterium]